MVGKVMTMMKLMLMMITRSNIQSGDRQIISDRGNGYPV